MRRVPPRRWSALAVGLLALALARGAAASDAGELLRLGPPADAAAPPPGWEPLTFEKVPRHTRYTVTRDGERWVLRAESHGAASGLYRPLDLDPRVHRILTWRWKIENVLARSDPRRKTGDDYPARIYVAFRYDPGRASPWERTTYAAYRLLYGRYPPKVVLNYLWESREPAGTVFDNAYTKRAKMIVVRSGRADLGRWVTERRDVYEDYRRVVGGEPPAIEGIALMTDTDDTGESAVAWYDAIALRPAE